MHYIDTSVLLVYTLTQSIEIKRFKATSEFFAKIISGEIIAATSFYALHELYIFAIENTPNLDTGYAFGKSALMKILSTPINVLPLVSRKERTTFTGKFIELKDSTDLPHAISAFSTGCNSIVTYDEHFRAISDIISCKAPEEFL